MSKRLFDLIALAAALDPEGTEELLTKTFAPPEETSNPKEVTPDQPDREVIEVQEGIGE